MSVVTEARARDLAFVLRCSGAATVSFLLAEAVALPHPVWAAMSAVIVSQEKLGDTRQVTVGRFFGTLLGVAIAVSVGTLAGRLGASIVAEMAIAVALAEGEGLQGAARHQNRRAREEQSRARVGLGKCRRQGKESR